MLWIGDALMISAGEVTVHWRMVSDLRDYLHLCIGSILKSDQLGSIHPSIAEINCFHIQVQIYKSMTVAL